MDYVVDQYYEEKKILLEDWKQLNMSRKRLKYEKRRMGKRVKMSDIIRLNIGGEKFMTTRASVTRVPRSALALLFNGRWEHKLNNDFDGYLYFDFNPQHFRYLLEQLRTLEDVNSCVFHPPSTSAAVSLSFNRMLKKLGFPLSVQSSSDIIAANIGGESLITQRKTLLVSNLPTLMAEPTIRSISSNIEGSNMFIDTDPQLFRGLIANYEKEAS